MCACDRWMADWRDDVQTRSISTESSGNKMKEHMPCLPFAYLPTGTYIPIHARSHDTKSYRNITARKDEPARNGVDTNFVRHCIQVERQKLRQSSGTRHRGLSFDIFGSELKSRPVNNPCGKYPARASL